MKDFDDTLAEAPEELALDDVSIEELRETAGAGTAFSIGSAGCPSSAGTASSFG